MGRRSKCNRPTVLPPLEGSGTFDSKAPMYWVVPRAQTPPASYILLPAGVNGPCSRPDTQPVLASKSPSSNVATGKRQKAMNFLADGLEGAAMPSFPFISSISCLLQLTANLRKDMGQYKEGWEVVTYRLEEITTLLNCLGKWCTAHRLEERDLPPSLREIFQRLRTKLDEVRHDLVQRAHARSTMRKIISRKDMTRRIKACDVKLSHLLQTLQVALAIDARLEQVKVIRNSRGRCTYDDRVVRLPSRDSC